MLREGDPGTATDRLFTGQRRLGASEIYDYGARLYSTYTGRFTQADTIVPEPGNPQALNRYSYVNNNPMRYNDPTGHKWDDGGSGCTQATCDAELGWDDSGGGGGGGNDYGTYCGPWAPGNCPASTPGPHPFRRLVQPS